MPAPLVPARAAADQTARGEAVLLDVRELFELSMAAVPGALHIRMQDLPANLARVPRDKAILVLCHHGARSQMVADWLQAQGYAQVSNVAGGIAAWADEVDASVGRY